MAINLDINARHSVVAANSHYYKNPTDERYIDRVLLYHDFIYLLEGRWAVTENGREYHLEPGDVLLLAAGRHHYTRLPCLAGTRTYCMHITCEPGDTQINSGSLCLPSHMHMRSSARVRSLFEDILQAHWSEDPYRQFKMSALLDLLILELQQEHEAGGSERSDIAERAMEFINATPHKRFNTSEIAGMLYVSPRTLDNAMRKKVGMPFYSYQKNRKLEMVALRLQMEPDLRLQEIAISFGFHDEFHMSKAFKKKYGVSPTVYRKNALESLPQAGGAQARPDGED